MYKGFGTSQLYFVTHLRNLLSYMLIRAFDLRHYPSLNYVLHVISEKLLYFVPHLLGYHWFSNLMLCLVPGRVIREEKKMLRKFSFTINK